MSKVAIQGNASGTGTFTIAAPNSNTDRTLTLPDEAGTVLTTSSDVLTSASSIPSSQITGSLGGTTLVDSGSFTGATTVSADSVFTSTYKNYRLFINSGVSNSGDQDFSLQMRSGGSTNGTSNYSYTQGYVNIALNKDLYTAFGGDSNTDWFIFDNHDNSHDITFVIDLHNPATTNYTQVNWNIYGYDNGYTKWVGGFGRHKTTTSFDGWILSRNNGTVTGTYTLYGWNES